MITQTVSLNHRDSPGSNNSIQESFSESGNTAINVNQSFAANTTNAQVTLAFTAANLRLISLVATQNMTLKTNSYASPGDTINLIAGIPLVWDYSSQYFPNPFTHDVTTLYVTCTASATLQIKGLTT